MTEWLNTNVGEAVAPYASFGIALVVVLILIALFFRLIKAMRSGALHGGQRNRLSIVEAATLEGKRRLVLVRRDDVEHLILIGGENDVVVEHNIVRRQADPARAPAPRMTAQPQQPQPAPALATAAAAQRPAIEAPLPTTAPIAKPSEPRQSLTETRSAPPAPTPAPVPTYGSAPAPASAPPAPNATPVVASAVPAAVASTPVAAAVIVPSVSATSGSVANNPTAAPYDSARIDQDMNRLLDQLAGD
ncbi:MAG: FliO/MopB family protein [Rhizobiales bacterium]|nr:FliO/MopB family protein [Hyphomicrobiales bacterium]